MLIRLNQRTDFQLAATSDHPHGRVVSLRTDDGVYPGWCDAPDDAELLDHPIFRRMAPGSDAASRRLAAVRKAEVARDNAIAKANADHAAAVAAASRSEAKETAAAVADWEKRKAAAAEAGRPFDEPHPDPTIASIRARTGGPVEPMTTAAMRQVEVDDDVPSRTVTKPPPKASDPKASDPKAD